MHNRQGNIIRYIIPQHRNTQPNYGSVIQAIQKQPAIQRIQIGMIAIHEQKEISLSLMVTSNKFPRDGLTR